MSQENITIEQARAKLREWIPKLVRAVFARYRIYLRNKPRYEPKAFNDSNQAARSAVAHLQQLFRLYALVKDAPEMTEDLAREIAALEIEFADGADAE